MGKIISSLMSESIFSWMSAKAKYFLSLEENLAALHDALAGLLAVKENVISKVYAAEENPKVRQKKVVTLWLQKVKDAENKVLALQGHRSQQVDILCFRDFLRTLKPRYDFGNRVACLKKEVTDLKDEGEKFGDNVAEREPAAPAIRLATERIMASRGQQSTVDEVWGCIVGEPAVGIISLHGKGGVGKTTLLKEINNKFCDESHDFQVVIWIVVSNEPRVEKIQEEIGKKIGFSNESWKSISREEKATDISNTLGKKKFILLLDDIWNRIDLIEVGVPLQRLETTGSKIAFTTRNVDNMEADKKFEVKSLADTEAWELFQKMVGKETLVNPSILKQAQIMYKECDGLPLALVTIGRVMACKRTREEWELAIDDLRTLTSKFSGMQDKVFSRLKLSYDDLLDDTIRSCFLYCCLFPEQYKISKRHLIDCWIGEGFIDVYNRGYSIINDILCASLLEEDDDDDYIKMNDVIRDMSLWIAEEERENFLVKASVGLTETPEVGNWEKIKRLSLMCNKIESLPEATRCNDLVTLFLNDNGLKAIPGKFFQSMSTLKVLDLANNRFINKLPSGISNLVLLQHLDLSDTMVSELPETLHVLVNLKCLKVENASNLHKIPRQLISKFKKLQVFRIAGCDSYNKADVDSILFGGCESLVEELFDLKQLNALSATLKSCQALENFLRSHKLKSCAQYLFLSHFKECENSAVLNVSFLEEMKNLTELYIQRCCSLKFLDKINIKTQGFHSIQVVVIRECDDLHDLTWLILAPNLKRISISKCANMDEIISAKKLGKFQKMTGNLDSFVKLQFLELRFVPHLKSICPNPLPFPHLKELHVQGCPNLKVLPLNSNSAKKSQMVIYGKEDWWNELQWDDEATRNVFLPCYKGFDYKKSSPLSFVSFTNAPSFNKIS